VILGVVVGFVTVFVRRRLNEPVLDTAISFAVPFLAFLPAEELKASGVIAVVAAGLYSGYFGPRYLSPQARFSERFNWRTVQFVLENGVFLLMGAQLAGIVADVHVEELSADKAVYLGLLMAAILIVLRFGFVWPLLALVKRSERLSETRLEKRAGATRQVVRRQNDVAQLRAEGLDRRGAIVLGWAGMRGVVTLAAAQSLPQSTPYREQLILIAFTVALVTLLLQGGTLPLVIRWVKIQGADRVADRRELATLLDEMSQAGIEALESPSFELPDGQTVDAQVLDRVRSDTLLATQTAWERAEQSDDDDGILRSPHQQYRALRREVLAAEREALLDARSRGAYPSRILERAQSLLDQEESRLEQLENGGRTE
jgi:monovalent cation/hydrogen antiporter